MLISPTHFGGRVVVNGAALQFARYPDAQIPKIPKSKQSPRPETVSKIDLARSRQAGRKFSSEMPGNMPPKDSFAKGCANFGPTF